MAARTKKGAAEATPKTLTATPSGIQIAYFTEPKRIYKIIVGHRQRCPGYAIQPQTASKFSASNDLAKPR